MTADISLHPQEAARRQEAAAAAAGVRAFIADASSAGKQSVAFASGRPQHWHIWTFENLPGFSFTVSFNTRSAKPPEEKFTHQLLPKWVYEKCELEELACDLEHLAATGEQPTEVTTPGAKPQPKKPAHPARAAAKPQPKAAPSSIQQGSLL